MARDWDIPVGTDVQIRDWRDKYNKAHESAQSTFSGAGTPSKTKEHMMFVDTTAPAKLKMRNSDDTGNIEIGDVADAANNLGHFRRDCTLAMEGNPDLDGYNIVLDQDGDFKLVGDRDGGVGDDQVVFRVGATDVLLIDAASGTKLLDLKSQLRLKNPEGISATAPGTSYGRMLIETPAGTRCLEVFNT